MNTQLTTLEDSPLVSRSIAGEATSPAGGASGSRTPTTGAAAAVQTGAMGMGALLGAAAVYFM
jgi:hypothetical protein